MSNATSLFLQTKKMNFDLYFKTTLNMDQITLKSVVLHTSEESPCDSWYPLMLYFSSSGAELRCVNVYEVPPRWFRRGWALEHRYRQSHCVKSLVQSPLKARWHRPQPKKVDEGDSKLTMPGGGKWGALVPEHRILTRPAPSTDTHK